MNKVPARPLHRRAGVASRIALGACAVLVTLCAHAEEPQPAAPPQAANQPASQPGFIDALGRWLQEGASGIKSGVQGAQERLEQLGKQAQETTKGVTGAVVALPNARMFTAQERCPVAANGAPDCQAAATSLCRGKGFQTGKVVDSKAEQKCSGRFLLEGRSPNSSDCASEIFVTRAICQ